MKSTTNDQPATTNEFIFRAVNSVAEKMCLNFFSITRKLQENFEKNMQKG